MWLDKTKTHCTSIQSWENQNFKPRCKKLPTKNLRSKILRASTLKGLFTQAIFVALKLQQVSNLFETPAISRRQIALKIAPGLHVRFWRYDFSAPKIACVNGPYYCSWLTRDVFCLHYWRMHVFRASLNVLQSSQRRKPFSFEWTT